MAKAFAAAVVAAAAATLGHAHAGVEELKLGLLTHNTPLFGEQNAENEGGANVSAQATFASLGFLRWAGSPRPYLYASVNLDGATNFGGAGLSWRIPVNDRWAVEPALGYVVHDGAINLPFPNGDPRAQTYSEDNVLFGSRDLFQSSFAINRRLGEAWSAEFYYEHLSHGQILGEGRNQGLDNFGLRLGYRLGD